MAIGSASAGMKRRPEQGFDKGSIDVSVGSESFLFRPPCSLVSVSYQPKSPFHGSNAGSYPAGDANKTNNLRDSVSHR